MYVCESPAHETIGRHAWDANRAFIIRATAHHAELLAFVDSIGSNAGSRYDACSSSVRREARELLSKVKGT
jgi:hypothetical protein